MDQLAKYSKDGHSYFCFIQVKEIYFSSIPKSTVKNWLRDLKIKCTSCSEEERQFFKNAMPTLTGSFGKISCSDLEKLLEYSKYKKSSQPIFSPLAPTSMPLPATSTSSLTPTLLNNVFQPFNSIATNSTSIYSTMPLPAASAGPLTPTPLNNVFQPTNLIATSEISEDSKVSIVDLTVQSKDSSLARSVREQVVLEYGIGSGSPVAKVSDIATEKNMGGGEQTSKQNPSIENEEMPGKLLETTCVKETIPIGSCNSFSEVQSNTQQSTPVNKGGNPRIRYSLSDEHMTPELKEELKNLRSFYTSDINSTRQGSKLTECTINKVNERILCFLGFVKSSKPGLKSSLSLTSSVELVEEFVNYLTKDRNLMASTTARSLSAIVSAIRYDRRDVSDIERLPALIRIRNMQRQLCGEESLTRKRKREGFESPRDKEFFFGHITQILRQLREKFQNSSGLTSSRFLHDFTMLSLYIRALPGRTKELRTLVLIDNSNSEEPFSTENVDNLNALVFEPDESISLVESDFKTVKKMGPSRIDITDDEWLVYFIKTYVSKHRPALLLGKEHDYVFCNTNGSPFLGIGSLSKYLGDLFEREVEVRASTTKMRHAIVTHFMSLSDSENVKLRESLASLLKHSVRHQQKTYNDQRRQERVDMGRKFMRKTISECDPFGEEDGEMASIRSYSKQVSEGATDDAELLPLVGEICALLDPASTGPKNAFIFVAKVIRYTPDKKRVCLQEMESVPESTDLYRVKCSSTWWENVECLSYPVDIVYVASEKAYHLRTAPEQIYNDVKLQK